MLKKLYILGALIAAPAYAESPSINRDSDLERAESLLSTLKSQDDRISESLDKIQGVTGKRPPALKKTLFSYLETPIVNATELVKNAPSAAAGSSLRFQVTALTDLVTKIHNEGEPMAGSRNERVSSLLESFLYGSGYTRTNLCSSWPDGRVSDFYRNFCQ